MMLSPYPGPDLVTLMSNPRLLWPARDILDYIDNLYASEPIAFIQFTR